MAAGGAVTVKCPDCGHKLPFTLNLDTGPARRVGHGTQELPVTVTLSDDAADRVAEHVLLSEAPHPRLRGQVEETEDLD